MIKRKESMIKQECLEMNNNKQIKIHLEDLDRVDSEVLEDLMDFRINLDKEGVNHLLETYLKSLKNSLADRKVNDPADKEEEWASNKARISF